MNFRLINNLIIFINQYLLMHQLTAGIIIIGDEILSGRTKETNANFIAKQLIKIGIKLSEIIIIVGVYL